MLLWMLLSPAARALDPQRALDHYGHQAWRTDAGLPQNTVHAVLQTRDGYLWLGTDGGLVRFDGIDFVTFGVETNPAFHSNTVYDLEQDADGALWISTAAGLVRAQHGVFAAYTTAQGLPADTVWFCYQDRSRRLWAMTAGGPAWLQGQRFSAVPDAQGAVPLSRQGLAEDGGGRLWLGSSSGVYALEVRDGQPRVGTHLLDGVGVDAVVLDRAQSLWIGSNEGLVRWRDGALTPVPLAGLPARTDVTALLADSDGSVWAGTAVGLAHWQPGGSPGRVPPLRLDGQHVDRLFQDHQGTLWIASERGLFRRQGEQVQAFAAGTDLAGNRVLALYEDREGDLWLGTDAGGLHVLRDQKFTTYTTQDGLSGNVIRSVLESVDGALWIGTDGEGLNRRTADGFRHYSTADGLSSNVILSLASGAGSDLWVGTPDGLNLLHAGEATARVQRFTSAEGLPDDFIRSLYRDPDGSLWVGTRHGLAHLVDGRFTSFSALDGLGSDFIGAIFRSRDGDLWIGTAGGLSRLRAGRFTNFAIPQGLSHNTVTAIAQSGEGALWLGTNGGGLERAQGDITAAFPGLRKDLPGTIYAILEDRGGQLWLSAPTGIYRIAGVPGDASRVGPGGAAAVTAYGTADGMNIQECSGGGHPSAWQRKDGTLWFATLDGVSMIDPQHTTANQVPPPVVIEQVLVDDQARPVDGAGDQELTIPPGASRLEFQYAGLSFRAPKKVQYRYQLQGFDRGWIEAGTRRAAFYTNLPPGRYRFRVVAANSDGVWNDRGAWFGLRLRPHYYQTYWFYAALLLGCVLLGYQAYRWRVQQVEAQFRAVLAERGRLAREIHDTLAQGFVGISVQLELVARLLSGGREAPPKPALDQLDQARALVRESLAEARSSIWDLRSENSAGDDLPARLRRACNRIASGSLTKVYLQVMGTYRPVARQTEDELLRIGQEGVANAVRHAAATRIDVALIYEAHRMLLQVVDDGRGFTPLPGGQGPEGHYGIQGMHERAQQIGATLRVDSAPGAGTRITVETLLG
jgi:ligand-binding sensor domain-containing protein/signal transduction histidine kinase